MTKQNSLAYLHVRQPVLTLRDPFRAIGVRSNGPAIGNEVPFFLFFFFFALFFLVPLFSPFFPQTPLPCLCLSIFPPPFSGCLSSNLKSERDSSEARQSPNGPVRMAGRGETREGAGAVPGVCFCPRLSCVCYGLLGLHTENEDYYPNLSNYTTHIKTRLTLWRTESEPGNPRCAYVGRVRYGVRGTGYVRTSKVMGYVT